MSTMNPHRWAPALVAVLSLALGCTACADDGAADDSAANPTAAGRAHPGAPTKKGLVIGFLPKQVRGNLYFSVAGRGGERAVTRLGSTYQEVGTAGSTDTAGQISRVDELTEQRVDAVVVSAKDPEAPRPRRRHGRLRRERHVPRRRLTRRQHPVGHPPRPLLRREYRNRGRAVGIVPPYVHRRDGVAS
ncbi:hypothetical protein [Streptomyces sp. SID5910]|uniref:hypothetical protein n=1 Tax=Streptomyces sp. SID5910 TaxID=2690312 RepID=UPI00136B5242|nr:hypothetical protein [Streptomyces sp. SID5910]MYR44140.1 hypothetical protein [Streptomyces sp. SID5910]